MSLARGLKGKERKPILLKHRKLYYEKAIDSLLKGEVTPEFVFERARKLKDTKKSMKQ